MQQRCNKKIGILSDQRGFTLIELMIAVVIIGILASIAIPSYKNYITQSHAKAAAADLMAASTALENIYQRTLAYPTVTVTTTADTKTQLDTWSPSEDNYFVYKLAATATTYTITAAGQSSMSGCTLTLNESNTRTVNSASACVISSW